MLGPSLCIQKKMRVPPLGMYCTYVHLNTDQTETVLKLAELVNCPF